MKTFKVEIERTVTQSVVLDVEAETATVACQYAMHDTARSNGGDGLDWQGVDEVDRVISYCRETAPAETATIMSWEELKAAAAKLRERENKTLDTAAALASAHMAQTMSLLDFVMFGTTPEGKK